jgi:hypothetical protein
MGADFIFAITPVTDADREELIRRFDLLSQDELFERAENGGFYMFEDDETDEEVTQLIWNHLIESIEYLNSDPRDAGGLTIEGRTYAVTGGMSWGDSPTEAFEYIRFLESLGITDDEQYEKANA